MPGHLTVVSVVLVACGGPVKVGGGEQVAGVVVGEHGPLAAGQLRCLATPLPAIQRQCHLIVPRHKQITPALQAFIAFATAFATTPGNAALLQKH